MTTTPEQAKAKAHELADILEEKCFVLNEKVGCSVFRTGLAAEIIERALLEASQPSKVDWRIKEALEQMTAQFKNYVGLHSAKNTGEGNEKAATNRHYQIMGEKALAILLASQPQELAGWRTPEDFVEELNGFLNCISKQDFERLDPVVATHLRNLKGMLPAAPQPETQEGK